MATVEGRRMSRSDIATRIKEIDELRTDLTTEYEGLAFTESAKAEWNGLNEERDELKALDEELETRERVVAEQLETAAKLERSPLQVRTKIEDRDLYDLNEIRAISSSPQDEVQNLRDYALRAVERTNFPHPNVGRGNFVNNEDCQAHTERIMRNTQESVPGEVARRILSTGNPTYSRALAKKIANQHLTAEEERAMTVGTPSAGGYAIPYALDPTLVPTSNYVVNPARALGNVVTIAGSNTWLGVTSPTVTASRVAEDTEATDNSPTLAQPSITVTKAHSFVPFSIEVSEDWDALQSEMARMIQQGKDEEEGTAFVTGAGTGVNPQGFVTGCTNTVSAASGLTVTAANLYSLEAALPPRFRPNESFVANRAIYNVIRGIDTSGGAALWLYVSQGLVTQAPTPGNTGATLLGRGAWEASAMQSTVVNATKLMIVGDFSYFKIVDRIGMNIEVVPHIFGASNRYPIGQRGLYAYWRNSSRVLSASAFQALIGTT